MLIGKMGLGRGEGKMIEAHSRALRRRIQRLSLDLPKISAIRCPSHAGQIAGDTLGRAKQSLQLLGGTAIDDRCGFA